MRQGEHWQININLRYGVPGYLFVTSTGSKTDSFSALPPKAFPELGRFLGLACGALERVLQPEKVLTGKFGMVPDVPLHFHVLPLYTWILEAFSAAKPYHTLQTLNPEGYPVAPDAAELIAFVWRAFCFTGVSPEAFDAHKVADRLEAEIFAQDSTVAH
ncbi:MAG: hypothetical protein GQ535_01910 [Rhodobacteraceae bacterium]|nr:hypothetical protein [Paracoccaceae bacterium]